MSISTDDIFNKIYGSSATQETISLRGGKRYYIDNKPIRNQSKKTNTQKDNIKNGSYKEKPYKKQVKKNDIIIYSDPYHFPDDKLKEYIDKLYLDYYTSRSSPNTIYIIPSVSTLKNMYSMINTLTKDTVKGSSEERKIIMENADKLGYKRYIFSKYGDNKKDQNYKIGPNDDVDNEYPNKEFDILRRINVANEVYYLSYDSPKQINISTNADMKKSVKLDFVGRCSRGVYIFSGDLPKESPEIYIDKYEKRHAMMGGGKSYIKSLQSFMNSYNNKDIAVSAFIAKRYSKNPELVKKYINADKYYTFFGIIRDDISNKSDFNDIFGKVNDSQQIEQEMEQYSMDNLTENMSSRIEHSLNRLLSKKHINAKDSLSRLYKNKDENVINADIMTALYHDGIKDFNKLLSITDNSSDNMIYNDVIIQAYKRYPMTSNIGKSYGYIGFGNNSNEKTIKEKKYNEETYHEKENDEKDIPDDAFY